MEPKLSRTIKAVAVGFMFGSALYGAIFSQGAAREGFVFLCGFALFKLPDLWRRSKITMMIRKRFPMKMPTES